MKKLVIISLLSVSGLMVAAESGGPSVKSLQDDEGSRRVVTTDPEEAVKLVKLVKNNPRALKMLHETWKQKHHIVSQGRKTTEL